MRKRSEEVCARRSTPFDQNLQRNHCHGAQLGTTWSADMGLYPCGFSTDRRNHRDPMLWGLGIGPRCGPWQSVPWLWQLAFWEHPLHLSVAAARAGWSFYQLLIVDFSCTHSVGSAVLEKGWSCSCGEGRWRLFNCSSALCIYIEAVLDKLMFFFAVWFGEERGPNCCWFSSTEHSLILESLDRLWIVLRLGTP